MSNKTQDNDYSRTIFHWWIDALNQNLEQCNEQFKSQLDYKQAEKSGLSCDIQESDKLAINNASDAYVAFVQNILELSLNHVSIASEWSERAAHVMQKGLGIKTISL